MKHVIRVMAVLLAGAAIAACGSTGEDGALAATPAATSAAEAVPTAAPASPTATTAPLATATAIAAPTNTPLPTATVDETPATSEQVVASASSSFVELPLGETWTQINHVAGPGEEPCMCSDGSEFSFFVNAPEDADPDRVVLMFQGGGACWDEVTCNPALGTYKTTVIENRTAYEATDLPGGGIWDRSQVANPFADWTMVFVPYCTGDVHLGTRTATYGDITVEHKGAVNAGAAMDWVTERYGSATELFVTGSSAGSIPAPLYAGMMADRLPNAWVGHLSDASGAYPSVPVLNDELGSTWGARDGLPDWPEFADISAEDFSLPGLFTAAGQHNPELTLARYDNAYDSVQSIFLLLNGLPASEALPGSIAAVEAAIEAEVGEIPSYIAPGDDHTILGSSRFYTEAVPGADGDDVVFADWVSALVAGETPDDVACVDCRR